MVGLAKILKTFRRTVAAVCFVLFVGLFADFGMSVPSVASWLAKIQFMPAALSFSLGIFITWLLVTLIFGRIYCSVACPLGIFQDICARLPRMKRRLKSSWQYHFSAPHSVLRYSLLSLTVLSFALGISAVTSLLDPYSVFGRFGTYILHPLWGGILNLFSLIDASPQLRMMSASIFGLVLASVTMLIVAAIAFRHGRTICNSICPVGTTLGIVSRHSLFRIDINTDRCIQCRRCEHQCKSSCIDLISHVVDTSRCVVCFDCLSDCPNDAISYTFRRHQLAIPMMQKIKPLAGSATGIAETSVEMKSDNSDNIKVSERPDNERRNFLTLSALFGLSVLSAKAREGQNILESFADGRPLNSTLPVTPPGVRKRSEFLDKCTACGLCISHCPQKVLKPSVNEYGILRALHPVMDYNASWCVYNCTRCTNLCPSGALNPLTISEKHHNRQGCAITDRFRCISFSEGVSCGACSRRCPTGAITMTPSEDGRGPYPSVDKNKCIGCGACQYVCPAKTKAIVVRGLV